MRKTLFATLGIGAVVASTWLLYSNNYQPGVTITAIEATVTEDDEAEEENYDGPAERADLEFMKTVDPALGYVPYDRLNDIIEGEVEAQQFSRFAANTPSDIMWEERGPIRDIVGPSNGNLRGTSRANLYYTSGRIRAVLVDYANDPTGNTVLAAGVAGGLWRSTNLWTSDVPDWTPVNDFFSNMAISTICQDPSNPQIMYFATGEPTSNADAVLGGGFWKSEDAGQSWHRLPSTDAYIRTFDLVCDASGNVYAALRSTATPKEQPYGLIRSKNGGQTWENITPNNLTSANNICTDLEITSTGRLHAAFGYLGGTNTVVNHVYTDNPATISTSGWIKSTGIRTATAVTARRMKLASAGTTLYAVTTGSNDAADSLYRSTDNGATWTRQNSTAFTGNIGQAWYNLTLAVNPANTNEVSFGCVDAYRSLNAGATISRFTAWVSVEPYVHADHHFMEWKNVNGENRVLIAGDGGIFISRDGGTTWQNRNENHGIKQFYDASIHPAAGSPILLAGAQDNGSHLINSTGLTNSVEVTGGDGAFVHINQQNPNIMFTSFVFNQYRRSNNGGASFSSINFSSASGLFINPYDYDDATNTLYASWASSTSPNNAMLRWLNANTGTSAQLIGMPALARSGNSNVTSVKTSPHTPARVFVGSNRGSLVRVDNALTAPVATAIGGNDFPFGFLNCVNVGSSDDHLVAVFTNYGVNNVWVSHDGGTSWTAVDGDLPDMPVRWAIFHPQFNNRLILATEAGVYTTKALNGASTHWTRSPGFPLVRTDVLEMRTSDYTIVAATHGRGMYTGQLMVNMDPEVNFVLDKTPVVESPGMADATNTCRTYKDYNVALSILNTPATDVVVKVSVDPGSAATEKVDFDYTTNGDFSNASHTVTFPSGSGDQQNMTVRIYDDAEVESEEDILFMLEVISGTDASIGALDQHTFLISDLDREPVAGLSIQPVPIGFFGSQVVNSSPFTGQRARHRVQHLISATELLQAGIQPGAALHNLALEVMVKNSTAPFHGFTIAIGHTTRTNLGNGFIPATEPLTTVWTGDYSTVLGMNQFNFTTPFMWDGTSNIAIQYCFDNEAFGTNAEFADFVAGNTYPLGAGTPSSSYSNFTNQPVAACELPVAVVSNARPNPVLGVAYPSTPIASALSGATEYLNAYNDLFYLNAAGELVVRVTNYTMHDYGCTNVSIDRSGQSAVAFWNANKKNFLASKTYIITPANRNDNGEYQITVYYTKAEKEGWEAATGNLWKDIQLIRTTGAIKDVTPSNAKPNNNGTVAEVAIPEHGTYGDGYTLTAVFKGMGGVGAGMPGRQFNNIIARASEKANPATEQVVQVINNPFGSDIRLRFARPLAQQTVASLLDISGKTLLQQNLAKGSSYATISTGNTSLVHGKIYLLRITDAGKQYVIKVMKD